MEFHPQKCQLIRITNKKKQHQYNYTIHGHQLEQVESAKYLGVNIHQHLSWNTHIDSITKKGNNTVGFLQRNLHHLPQEVRKQCYETLVRPSLEYASSVWDPHTQRNINKLEAVQRRAARFVCQDYRQRSSVSNMITNLNWQTLKQRRSQAKVIMFYCIIHNLVEVPVDHLCPAAVSLRGHTSKYHLPYARIAVYQHSYYPSAIRLWNSLDPSALQAPTLDVFKTHIQMGTTVSVHTD